MADINASNAPRDKEIQIPEWEDAGKSKDGATVAEKSHGATRAGFAAKLDHILPPHKRYLGMGRKIFLLVLLAVSLALLALIIGLAVGLSNKSKSSVPHFLLSDSTGN